ncbi:MAG: DUF1461 domain-containing protein [Nanoarchaeota archaeon]
MKDRKTLILIMVVVVGVWLTAFFSMYTQEAFYEQAFEEAGVYAHLGNETVSSFHPVILSFLSKNTLNDLLPELLENQLSAAEKSHLIDVKHLIDYSRILYGLILVAALSLIAWDLKKKRLKELGEGMEWAGLISMGLLLLSFLSSFFFSSFFTVFHRIFFPLGNYAFPATSLLIQLYPEGVFLKGFEIILGMVLMQSVILLMFGYLLKEKAKT